MVKLIFRKENKRINIKNKENLSRISRKKREKERERERELKFMEFTKAFKGSSKAEIIEARSLIVFYDVTFSKK